MGVLQSKLFNEGDPATLKKLEDCATGHPSEVNSHFRRGHVNSKGEHIKKVQQALKNVQQNRPEFNIPDFDVNGVYDERFAKAVYVYKQKKDIRNYANKIDDIIGIKTIKSLDSDNINRPHTPPSPKPKKNNAFLRPLPNCVPEADCPFSRDFSVTLLFGASGGEIADLCKYWFTIRDTKNGLSAAYLLSGYGVGFSVLPVGIADGGDPKAFTTGDPARVTDFGPTAILAGAGMLPVGPVPVSGTLLTLQYRPGGSGLKSMFPLSIDTGKVTLPGVNLNGASFKLLTACRGGRGAVKQVVTRSNFVFS